jgi:hypothetical protein
MSGVSVGRLRKDTITKRKLPRIRLLVRIFFSVYLKLIAPNELETAEQ